MKKAGMVAFFVATITTAIFTLAQNAYAQTNKVDIPIYQRCKRNPLLLSIGANEGECIVGKHIPQKQKQADDSKPPLISLATATSSNSSSIQPISSPQSTSITLASAIITPSPTEAAPTPLPVTSTSSAGSLNADVLFSLVNATRAQFGLPPFQQDANVCSIAQSRLPQIYDEIMVNHNLHAGFYALNLPYWATENLIYQPTEQAALNWWMNEPIHRAAILSNNTYSCAACTGNACTEIFTNYLQK